MKRNKHKWIEDVLNSSEGMSRAKPSRAVFGQIEKELFTKQASIFTIKQWMMACAASCALLIANLALLNSYTTDQPQDTVMNEKSENSYALVSDYNLYEL